VTGGTLRAPRGRSSGGLRTPWSSGLRVPAAVPVAALVAIGLLDVVAALRTWPTAVVGLLDWPAHLLTAWLFLAALGFRLSTRVQAWALVGAIAIDVDHVPLYLHWHLIPAPGGRPVTHSLATVVLLLAVAAVPRLRAVAAGLALGLLLHLSRDVVTGPGVTLGWPVSELGVRLPYPLYVAALVVTTAVAVLFASRRRGAAGGGVSDRAGTGSRPPSG
jgi:inner membrane protein